VKDTAITAAAVIKERNFVCDLLMNIPPVYNEIDKNTLFDINCIENLPLHVKQNSAAPPKRDSGANTIKS
jgi:hypothetical protein